MPVAMALLRDVQNLCPKDVLNFILDLIKYNDNRKNKVKTQIYTFIFQLSLILQDFISAVDKTLQIHIISLVCMNIKTRLCLYFFCRHLLPLLSEGGSRVNTPADDSKLFYLWQLKLWLQSTGENLCWLKCYSVFSQWLI